GDPDIRSDQFESSKVLRRDADDGIDAVAELELRPECAIVTRELPHPESMADHNHGRAERFDVLVGAKEATRGWRYAEHREVAGRNQKTANGLRLFATTEGNSHAGSGGDHLEAANVVANTLECRVVECLLAESAVLAHTR